MEITYAVTITDIIQAIGVGLGFPVAVWGIIKLFKKDKEKEEQLNALNDIAISQNSIIGKMKEQIEELSKQTTQFEYQSSLFKEGNELLKEQVHLQTDALLNDKDYKEKYLELEKTKRKSEIKPFFKPERQNSSGSGISLGYTNFGKQAFFEGVEKVDAENVTIMPPSMGERVIENGGVYQLQMKSNNEKFNGNSLSYDLNLLFYDQDGNKYKQNIKGTGNRASIETPVERE